MLSLKNFHRPNHQVTSISFPVNSARSEPSDYFYKKTKTLCELIAKMSSLKPITVIKLHHYLTINLSKPVVCNLIYQHLEEK